MKWTSTPSISVTNCGSAFRRASTRPKSYSLDQYRASACRASSWTPCDRSATSSLLGQRVAAMRRRRSSTFSPGLSMRNGRISVDAWTAVLMHLLWSDTVLTGDCRPGTARSESENPPVACGQDARAAAVRIGEERMSRVGIDERLTGQRAREPTVASTWEAIAGGRLTDELLEWPPDLFALANVVLDRSEAFRFALSPIGAWPPARFSDRAGAVEEAGRDWGACIEGRRAAIPELLAEEWTVVREGSGTTLEELARGEAGRICEALLTVHAIADEACAGLGVALDSADGRACAYRARGRELLTRTGSLARLNPRLLRVL